MLKKENDRKDEEKKEHPETNGKADGPAEDFSSPENLRVAAAAALGAAAVKARVMAEREDRLVQRLVTQAVEVQLKKLELKLKHFDDMDELLDKEHSQVEHARQALYNERLALLQLPKGGDAAHPPAATPMQVDK